jgi:2-(1,2-epoxy-1,2-dihydrophenyl)acetyl-CoA isomerase
MTYTVLEMERHDHVALVRLNRPDTLNALSAQLQSELHAAIDEVRADDEIRVLVLTGTGRGFSSGADLSARRQREEGNGERAERAERAVPGQSERMDEFGWVGRQAMAVYGLGKPTIAAVNGVAAGAGMSLALACDLRVGGPSARFKTVFIERNLSPDSGMSWFLPRIVGYSRAADLVFTSRGVDAEEAYRVGLLDRLVPSDDDVLTTALALGADMAQWPPLAMRSAKRVLQHNMDVALDDGLRYEMFGLSFARKATNDAAESFRSFVEKRKPNFTGT